MPANTRIEGRCGHVGLSTRKVLVWSGRLPTTFRTDEGTDAYTVGRRIDENVCGSILDKMPQHLESLSSVMRIRKLRGETPHGLVSEALLHVMDTAGITIQSLGRRQYKRDRDAKQLIEFGELHSEVAGSEGLIHPTKLKISRRRVLPKDLSWSTFPQPDYIQPSTAPSLSTYHFPCQSLGSRVRSETSQLTTSQWGLW